MNSDNFTKPIIFRKIEQSQIEKFSPDGTEIYIHPSPNASGVWVPILQPYDDIINYEAKAGTFDFYLIGNDEEGYVQLPIRARRLSKE